MKGAAATMRAELIGLAGVVERNVYLTKRYFMWDVAFFVWTVANTLTIVFIAKGFEATGATLDVNEATTSLLIGAVIWAYLGIIFEFLTETVAWERWEGTIEYTFMAPLSRAMHLAGQGVFAIIYGLARAALLFTVVALFFDLSLPDANFVAALLVVAVASVSFIGIGMMTSVMPLISPEKGMQLGFIAQGILLVVSGVYYPVEVLPGWMQAIATISPATYALEGAREAIMEGAGVADMWVYIWPLIIIGVVSVPLGLWVFSLGERYAKHHGKLKRSGWRRSRRPKILEPFRVRDFGLYWTARTTSWLGDGVMVVALPWQVYELTNSPTAMGIVGALQFAPIFVFTLLGGVASDRVDRRQVILVSEVARGAAAGAAGVLAVTDNLELWHLGVMVVVFGLGQAFAGPAFGSIVPQLVPEHLLVQANSALFTFHTLAFRLVGPALGGVLIAAAGTGFAFLVDAGSFVIGAVAIALLAARPAARMLGEGERPSVWADLREGFGYVRARSWLWGMLVWWLLVGAIGTAPYVVLLPFLVKNELGGAATELGLVFAAGGAGGVVAALALSQARIPRRHITFMFALLAFGISDLFFYALTQAPWQAMVIAFVAEAALTGAILVWNTLVQRAVPSALLGRVRSLDSFAAFALTPAVMAVMGPAAAAFGVRPVLAVSGVAAATITVLVFLLPGMRETEGRIALSEV